MNLLIQKSVLQYLNLSQTLWCCLDYLLLLQWENSTVLPLSAASSHLVTNKLDKSKSTLLTHIQQGLTTSLFLPGVFIATLKAELPFLTLDECSCSAYAILRFRLCQTGCSSWNEFLYCSPLSTLYTSYWAAYFFKKLIYLICQFYYSLIFFTTLILFSANRNDLIRNRKMYYIIYWLI